ncbi:MAG TPA: hypothetical protein VD837_00515 [Terriglobales bacterium]|nr:hypothetical protein [Terriglobales bacterium]
MAAVGAIGQSSTKDIKAIFAEGKIADNQYRNDYFGFTLAPLNGHFTQGGFVSSEGKRARLIDAQSNATACCDRYDIAVLADPLSANPSIKSPEQYVRSVRHQLEREGSETVQPESPVEISGTRFVYATMKVGRDSAAHYRGIYTTFLNGYILSIDVSADSVAGIQQALKMLKFKAPQN